MIFLAAFALLAHGDYHYASHEGSNEYPYTSWETAAHMIQEAVDASEPYDTVYIGSGEWYEIIDMDLADSCVAIIGRGMDSTLIWTDRNEYMILRAHKTSFKDICFRHLGTYGAVILAYYGPGWPQDVYVNRCKFEGYRNALGILGSYAANHIIENSIFDSLSAYDGAIAGPYARVEFRNNICNLGRLAGLCIYAGGQYFLVENNYFQAPVRGFEGLIFHAEGLLDTLIVQNNIIKYFNGAAKMLRVSRGSKFAYNVLDSLSFTAPQPAVNIAYIEDDSLDFVEVIGNSIRHDDESIGIRVYPGPFGVVASVRYNNFWDVETPIVPEYPDIYDSVGNTFNDPMYVGSFDFHLQMFSPLIDAGDPEIPDPDGSRSDIGVYGGPLGEVYDYQDLPPLIPDSIYAYVTSDTVTINWHFNTEADFNHYLLYRDTVTGFEPSISNLIGEPDSSLYVDTDIDLNHNYYYRIASVDDQNNVSDYSEELAVILTDVRGLWGDNVPLLTSIVGNYPNPFNSRTIIRYNVGNIGPIPVDISIIIYDVLGREVKEIVEKERYPGEYEVTWDGRDNGGSELTSGVYFVKIVQWEDKIESRPRKIMLLK